MQNATTRMAFKQVVIPTNRIKLAHISDVHVWQPELFTTVTPSVLHFLRHNSLRDYKQIQGYLNVQYNRGPLAYQSSVFTNAMTEIRQQSLHHLMITGDLTNISLNDEFKRVRELIDEYYLVHDRTREDVWKYISVIPGNHDTYTHEAVNNDYFGKYFADTMGTYGKSETTTTTTTYDHFPNVKVLSSVTGGPQHVVIMGLCSGRPTKPFFSAGKLGQEQIQKANELLSGVTRSLKDMDPDCNIFTVIMMHHPPLVRYTKNTRKEFMHGLDPKDVLSFQKLCYDNDVNLVLNGHTHSPIQCWLPSEHDDHKTRVIDPGSGTYNDAKKKRTARYNTYEIENGKLVTAFSRVWDFENNSFTQKDIEML